MLTDRADHTATLLLDGRVLVTGGIHSPDLLASAELYDPGRGAWIAAGKMREARYNHTATLLPDGRVLVAGGVGSATAELYDPTSGTWTATASMKSVRGLATATLLPDGTVLVAGGSTSLSHGGAVASVELYDPASGTWAATRKLADARAAHTATLLTDGTVIVAGGFGDGEENPTINTSLVSTERYDPRTRKWAATGPLAEGRAKYTATLLLDGTILATRLGRLGSAERYDPDLGSWSVTGNMHTDRSADTATLLRDGTVLVAGGFSDEIEASAELYDPGQLSVP